MMVFFYAQKEEFKMEVIKNLGAAVLIQAVKDYFEETAPKQRVIIRDLKSDWLNFLTDGMSTFVAEKLKSNPEEIRRRLGGTHNA